IRDFHVTGVQTCALPIYFFPNGQLTSENTSSFAYGIPMVFGVKAKFMESFVLAAEIGARYTFSDEIDGSAPDYDNDASTAFGNKIGRASCREREEISVVG